MSAEQKAVGYKRLPPARVQGLELIRADARTRKLREFAEGAADLGVYIPTETPLPQGSFVEFDFRLEPDAPAYSVLGCVKTSRRSGEDPGMAVQFIRIERRAEEDVRADPERMWRRVVAIEGLPTLPVVVTRIMQKTVSEETSAGEVAELIAQDAALTAEVLRIVNSAYYSLRQPVSTVERAIVVLGFNTIKSVVLTASVVDLWEQVAASRDFDVEAFWEHSLGTAIACEVIAKVTGAAAPEDAFVAGLFHDLGKMVLNQFMGSIFAEITGRVGKRGLLIREAESEVMGFAHDRVGEWLLTNWNIPHAIVLGVANHHLPTLAGTGEAMAHVVNLGDIVCRALVVGSGGDDGIPALRAATWDFLGLSPARLDMVMGFTLVGVDNAGDFFRLIRS